MNVKTILLSLLAIVSAALIVVFIGQGIKNRAITYEEGIENAMSQVKVQEKRRFDLIPNLVECVKSYNEYEYKTLVEVVQARGINASTADEIKTLVQAVAERYPELKAQKNYQDLMNEIALTENKIAKMRDGYNTEVTNYRRYVRKFPNKQVLDMLGYDMQEFDRLEFENSSVDAPKVQF